MKWLHLFVILIITSCGNLSQKDQVDHLRALQGETSSPDSRFRIPEETKQWWNNYRRAKSLQGSAPSTSCQLYYDLSQEHSFLLWELALLRAIESCSPNHEGLKNLEVSYETYRDTYLKEAALAAIISWREKNQVDEGLIELYVERSKIQTLQSEKIESMDLALDVAKRQGQVEEVRALQERIEKIAPRRKSDPKWEELLAVAQDYRQARMFPEAIDAYQRYMRHRRAGPNEGYQALRGLRELRRLTRTEDLDLYLTSTQNLAKFTERTFLSQPNSTWTERHHAMSVQWARTLWTKGRRGEAEQVLEKLASQLKGKYSLSQIFWLRSRMDLEKNDIPSSLQWLERGRNEKALDRSLQEDLLWDTAWAYRKLGQHSKAIQVFEDLESFTDSDSTKHKSMYWRAKTLESSGQKEKSIEVLEDLIGRDVLGYYGVLAHKELDRPFSRIRQNTHMKDSPLELEWLIALEERELALAFVQDLWNKRGQEPSSSEDTTLGLLQLFAHAGEYLSLFRHFASLAPEEQANTIRENYGLLFPQIYRKEIADASQTFEVPEALIYSIIRQESAFNPRARSWADAFGLMQLLPSVGEATANQHDIPWTGFEDLYRPEKNVLLGSAFLKRLMRSHNSQFIVVVASYNASEKAIYNWIKTRYAGDPLEFIEEIPYRETQGYVKLVLRNFVFYQRLLSSTKQVSFPSDLLQGLGDIQASLSQSETNL